MKKYNLSKIMKRAWELVKKSALTISSGTNYDSNDLSELMANRNEMNLYERIHKYVKEH